MFIIEESTKDKAVQFTNEWWKVLLKDEPRLILWLQKLCMTELSGYTDYFSIERKFKPEDRTKKILTNIAEDELKHSSLIIKVLQGRGSNIDPNPPLSQYWKEMNSHIIDLPSACAVNYYGEALAAFRFEILQEHPDTPSDIKEMLRIILPDEQFHRETLKKLAGPEILDRFVSLHNGALDKLKKR